MSSRYVDEVEFLEHADLGIPTGHANEGYVDGMVVVGPISSGDQRHLYRSVAGGDQVQAFLKLFQGKLVGADLVQGQRAGLDNLDRGGPAVRAEMRAAYVQFLVVADDRPVDGDVAAEDAVLDIGAELAQQVEALADGTGARCPPDRRRRRTRR